MESKSFSKCAGLTYAILSGISFTLYSSFFKMCQQLSIIQVVFVRGVVQIILIIPFLIALRPDVRGAQGTRLLMWFGSFISTITVGLAFIAITILPFGDAMAIHFCSPVIVMLLSHCLLKEYCGLYKTSVVLLLLVGVSLITKPPGLVKVFSYLHMVAKNDAPDEGRQSGWMIYGYIAAFCATTTWACSTVIRKKLSASNHFSVVIFSCAVLNIIGSSISIPLLPPFSLPDDYMEIVYALLVGVFSMAGVMFHVLALRGLTASLVSMVRSSEIVMAYLMQILWFGESADPTSLAGASLVMLSVALITQEENIVGFMAKLCKKPEDVEYSPLVNNVANND